MKKTAADRCRALRAKKGWTQVDLAKAAGVTRDIVAKIETGWTQGKKETMERIATALGVSPALLMFGAEQAELSDEVWDAAKRLQAMSPSEREHWVKAIKAVSDSKD